MKSFLIVVAGVLLVLSGRAEAGAVIVTQAAPIQKLDSDGHPSGVSMAAVGSKFSLVKADGDNLILKDASGSEYEIAVAATDYSPPALLLQLRQRMSRAAARIHPPLQM